MTILLALLCITTTGIEAPPNTSSVWLDGHRGVFDASAEPSVLRLRALGHNHLNVPIEAVEIGVLFASEPQTLVNADLSRLYQPQAALQRDNARGVDTRTDKNHIGALRQWVDVRIEPKGEAVISLNFAPRPGDPEPATWVTHVLGYRLAEIDFDLLTALLHTDLFIDEVAVVETLALIDTTRKDRVRSRWGTRSDLITTLITAATAPPAANPNFQDALDRVFAIRALGVLGGGKARTALESLLTDSVLDPLDEPLLVVSIARLRNTPLEAPLAFAVPRQAKRMRDVVTAALDDVVGRKPAAAPTHGESVVHQDSPGPVTADAPGPVTADALQPVNEEKDGHSKINNFALGGFALSVVLLGIAVFYIQRRRN